MFFWINRLSQTYVEGQILKANYSYTYIYLPSKIQIK